MTNKEILQKAFDIAFNNIQLISILPSFSNLEELYKSIENGTYYRVIFSHEFAKAFFGEQYITEPEVKFYTVTDGKLIPQVLNFTEVSWKYNLQQMVLEEEPLKYLEKFL